MAISEVRPECIKEGGSGSSLSTMKVGGEAAYTAFPRTVSDLSSCYAFAYENSLTPILIGGGSNLILPDDASQCMLIRPGFADFTIAGSSSEMLDAAGEGRYSKEEAAKFLQLGEIPVVEDEGDRVLVTIGSGVAWGLAVQKTLAAGLIGLHHFSRIPCYVGGSVVNNIHAGSRLVGGYVHSVDAYDTADNSLHTISHDDMKFDYDFSIFHIRRSLCINSVTFSLFSADAQTVADARTQYLAVNAEKARVQPSGPNSGSTFQNIDAKTAEAAGVPHRAAGWFIDNAGLIGTRIGGMQVYEKHANFIVNTGEGTQEDWIALVSLIRKQVHETYGVWLHPEVEAISSSGTRLGFVEAEAQWK